MGGGGKFAAGRRRTAVACNLAVAVAVALVAAGGAPAGGAPGPEPEPERGRPPPVRLCVVASGAGSAKLWPRAAGIAIPYGFWRPGERLALFDGAVERPASIEGWVRDPLGEPRWVRVEAGAWPSSTRRLELRATSSPAPEAALHLEHRGGEIAVRARGPAPVEWRFDATGATVSAGRCRMVLDLGRLELDESGAAASASRLEPWRASGPDGAGVRLETRPRFAEEALAPGRVALALAVTGDGRVAELEVALHASRTHVLHALRVRGRASGGETAGGSGARFAGARPREPVERLHSMQRAALDAAGEAGELAVRVGDGRERLEWRLEESDVARPAGLALTSDGRFALALVAEPLLVHAGQVVRRRLRLTAGTEAAPRRAWLVAQAPALEVPDSVQPALAAWRTHLAAAACRPGRLDDRGCYQQPDGEFANGEYDLGASLSWLGARLADPLWLELGALHAGHTLDWDRDFEPRSGVPAGLFAQHGDDHASGKVETGHQWIGGALAAARTGGSREALATAQSTVASLEQWFAGERARFGGPERRLAWPLHAALDLEAATGDAGARRFAGALVEALLARQGESGFLDGDLRPSPAGARLWVNSWVSLGITCDGLARAEEQLGDPLAGRGAARLAEAVVRGALRDEALREVVQVDPASATSVARAASVTGGEAALAALGLEWLAGRPEGAPRRGALEALAGALRERAWRDLAAPADERTVDLAQALHAWRREVERREAARR